ncbi:rhamnogalacturonan acetylesterase [Aridibaculum aurantiacum]|uniref:rhamnogalacturonan acetylesterase n=1 Tax=Aridibaculum aurantiacum TaxID=2810307 RepID=UPI001A97B022|nr:rhamnogalacturonan acetylesterase [Aridibaculum aurantiacum]
MYQIRDKNTKVKLTHILVLSILFSACAAKKFPQLSSNYHNYDFSASAKTGYTKVIPSDTYTDERGYGFEYGSSVKSVERRSNNALEDGFVTNDTPFLFSVKLPEGNYDVKVVLGDKEGTSDAAIRAESRRMMVNRIQTLQGEVRALEFTVNLRDTIIKTNNSRVRIKPRERDYYHWDNKLTLEFNGEAPKVAAIEITPSASDVINVFLAGNSTVVDQASEPYAAWGQIIPASFEARKIAVANYAESGESLSSFISARRFEKMLSMMKKGDYAFVEFGHNDMKQKGEGIGAFTSYKKDLKFFIDEVRKKGATPVLVTSMQRRSFDKDGKITETLGDYPAAVRLTAKEENVALIDLNAMSKTMYEAWGPDESIKAFVHFPANTYPGQKTALADNTHFTPFGAYQISKLIIRGIRENKLGLAKYLQPGVPDFDPAKPDAFDSFYWPDSPVKNTMKPDGN